MVSDSETSESSETETESREQGVDIGPLADELEAHSYPATNSEIIDEYGDYEIDMPSGSQSLGEVLGRLEGEDEEYESADEVRQMIYNMVGSEAVGRENYSDRGQVEHDEEEDGENDSF